MPGRNLQLRPFNIKIPSRYGRWRDGTELESREGTELESREGTELE